MSKPLSFTRWLRRQWRRNDPVGDLARDMRRDPDWPGRARRLETYRRYLTQCGACEGALSALERAWEEWAAHGRAGGGEPVSRYQYRDCCPDCMTSTRPLIVVRGRRSSILALYECARCGRHWSCAWAEMPGGIQPVEVLPERR